MSTIGKARNACEASGAFLYQRHRPEKTLLYQLVSKHHPVFRQQLAEEGRMLPGYVQREFEDYLKCGRLEHGFLRVRCENCHEERLVAFSSSVIIKGADHGISDHPETGNAIADFLRVVRGQ